MKIALSSSSGVFLFCFNQSPAALNRVHPGTLAVRLTSVHFACRGGFWNSAKLAKKASTKRATFRYRGEFGFQLNAASTAPTATVLAGAYGQSGADGLIHHPVLGPRLSVGQQQTLSASFPGSELRNAHWPIVLENIRALHAAGVPILAGSDAPNPATAHGASMQHELALLIEAGLTPIEALASATSIPAQAFGLSDRGCLTAGCRADMVLIDGNPFEQPERFGHIAAVWKNGSEVELDLPEQGPARSASAGTVNPINLLEQPGRWMASTDQFMGGNSIAEQHWLEDDGRPRLAVQGQLVEGNAFTYAGTMWMTAEVPMQASNLNGYSEFQLQVSSDQTSIQVMFFSGETMSSPPLMRFFDGAELGADGGITIELETLAGLDLSMLRAIGVFAYDGLGEFEMTVERAILQ